jgi:signal transduction histidine kinase
MMEGFDKDWIKSREMYVQQITQILIGEYIFRVKGSNNDGVWNEKGASIKILITPPWWKTWWFRGCGIMLIIGILGYTRQRKISKIRQEIKRKEEFTRQLIESQETERKRIAGDLHDSLAQNLLVIKNRVSLITRRKETDNNIKGVRSYRWFAEFIG